MALYRKGPFPVSNASSDRPAMLLYKGTDLIVYREYHRIRTERDMRRNAREGIASKGQHDARISISYLTILFTPQAVS